MLVLDEFQKSEPRTKRIFTKNVNSKSQIDPSPQSLPNQLPFYHTMWRNSMDYRIFHRTIKDYRKFHATNTLPDRLQ